MNPTRLAKKLGGELRNGWVNIPGPGHSDRDRSLGVRLCKRAAGGFYVHSLAGDDPKICRAHVKARLGPLAKRARISIDRAHVEAPAKSNSIGALRLWGEGEPIDGTLAAIYLTLRDCAPATGTSWSLDLRFHPACPFGPYRFPALIARTRDVVTGEPTGIHRTALSDDGATKRVMPVGLSSKMTLGHALGAAVHLGNAGALLGIAEGRNGVERPEDLRCARLGRALRQRDRFIPVDLRSLAFVRLRRQRRFWSCGGSHVPAQVQRGGHRSANSIPYRARNRLERLSSERMTGNVQKADTSRRPWTISRTEAIRFENEHIVHLVAKFSESKMPGAEIAARQ